MSMELLFDRIQESTQLFVGGVFKVAAMRHYVGRRICVQLYQIIAVSTHFIGCTSRHQGGGYISGDDEFVAQDFLV